MRSSEELRKEQTKTMRIFPRRRVFLFVLNGAALLMSGQASEAQDRSQGRSMVISRNGIVAAGSPLAAPAGGGGMGGGGKVGGGAGGEKRGVGGVGGEMEGKRGGLLAVGVYVEVDKLLC